MHIVCPSPFDIKIGKHPEAHHSEATRNARDNIVKARHLQNFVAYQKSNSTRGKGNVITEAIEDILRNSAPEGVEVRFIKRLGNGQWEVMTEGKVRQVVGHWLRDLSPVTTKQYRKGYSSSSSKRTLVAKMKTQQPEKRRVMTQKLSRSRVTTKRPGTSHKRHRAEAPPAAVDDDSPPFVDGQSIYSVLSNRESSSQVFSLDAGGIVTSSTIISPVRDRPLVMMSVLDPANSSSIAPISPLGTNQQQGHQQFVTGTSTSSRQEKSTILCPSTELLSPQSVATASFGVHAYPDEATNQHQPFWPSAASSFFPVDNIPDDLLDMNEDNFDDKDFARFLEAFVEED